jgi:nickel-dependent lactate racemase
MVGSTPAQILERIQKEFVLGGHKAASIAHVLQKVSVLLVSDLLDELVQACSMEPFGEVDAAFQTALQLSSECLTITIIPEGAGVLPKLC